MEQLDAAIARLEKALIWYGGTNERALVFETWHAEPEWPTDVHITPELRRWLSWRPSTTAGLSFQEAADEPKYPHGLITVGQRSWIRNREKAVALQRPTFIPVLERIFADPADHSVWKITFTAANEQVLTKLTSGLSELLDVISATYEARAATKWRDVRLALLPARRPGVPTTEFDEMALSRAPTGTMIATTWPHEKRSAIRGSWWVKIGPAQWAFQEDRSAASFEDEVPMWVDITRMVLATGDATIHSDSELAMRIGHDLKLPNVSASMSLLRVWHQPSISQLLTRLDAQLRKWPAIQQTLQPGASEAQLSAFEKRIGRALPADLRALFTFSNGQLPGSATIFWEFRLLSLDESVATRDSQLALAAGKLGALHWDEGCVPLLASAKGGVMYVDLNGLHGSPGSFVELDPTLPTLRKVRYQSVTLRLECFVDALELDLFEVTNGHLAPRAFLSGGERVEIFAHDAQRGDPLLPLGTPARRQLPLIEKICWSSRTLKPSMLTMRSRFAVLVLLSLTTFAAPPAKKPPQPVAPAKPEISALRVAILETVNTEGFTHRESVNGFDVGILPSNKESHDHVQGFANVMQRYAIIRPYFLKSGENTLSATYTWEDSRVANEDPGPWQMHYTVANVSPIIGEGELYPRTQLAELLPAAVVKKNPDTKQHTSTVKFTWSEPVPEWRWTHGVKIQDTAATRESIYAEYAKFWKSLAAMYEPKGTTADPAFQQVRDSAKASIREFIQASELRGTKYTYLDELFDTARRGATPGQSNEPPAPPKKNGKVSKIKMPSLTQTDTVPDPDEPFMKSPDGTRPPRVSLSPLLPLKETRLVVFAGGTLAMLISAEAGEFPLIQFHSNYHDGSWGAGGEAKAECNLWFRKNDKGEWELDAVYDMRRASLEIWDHPMKDLMEEGSY